MHCPSVSDIGNIGCCIFGRIPDPASRETILRSLESPPTLIKSIGTYSPYEIETNVRGVQMELAGCLRYSALPNINIHCDDPKLDPKLG